MASYFARNIRWSSLSEDNQMTATFDIHDDANTLVEASITATDTPTNIQTTIASTIRSRVAILAEAAVARAEAQELYNLITQETELEVPLTA